MARRLQTSSRLLGAVLLLGLVLSAGMASADTVYLKNGRKLHALRVQVMEAEGKVVLEQAGNRIEIPLSIVDRIERDAEASEVLEPDPELVPAESGEEEASESTEAEAAESEAAEEGEGEEGEETPSEQTRQYWQDAVRAIRDERVLLEDRLEELRREERAFLFSHRSTAETKQQIEQVQARLQELDEEMRDLKREARREGIPPGWLRIDGG